MTCVLVTSACSYHGRHLVAGLRAQGHDVIAWDDGLPGTWDGDLWPPPLDAELITSELDDLDRLDQALKRAKHVIHLIDPVHPLDRERLRAPPPLAQTVTLLRAAAAAGVERLVLQSSLTVYGEGRYIDEDGVPQPARRTIYDLEAGRWQARCLRDQPIAAMPTPEDTPPAPLTHAAKLCVMRERMVRKWSAVTGAKAAVLRMGRLFGPPLPGGGTFCGETGLMASHLLAGRRPPVLEDGGQTDDWLHVHDAVRAFRLALLNCTRDMLPLNISSGIGHSAADIAGMLAMAAYAGERAAAPLQMACKGTARHLVGEPGTAEDRIGFVPGLSLSRSLADLILWTAEAGTEDRASHILENLHRHAGLVGPGRRRARRSLS